MRRVGYNELIFENMVYLVKYQREREREREKHNVIFVSKKCHCILYLCAQRHNTRDLGVDRVTFRDNQFRRI
jgi:formyltetrahydrofolate hydrolase